MNRRQFLTLAASGLLLSACGRNEPIHPPTPLTAIVPRRRLRRLWQTSLGKGVRQDVPGVRIAENEGRIYALASSGTLACVDMAGKTLWQQDTATVLLSGPVLSPVADTLFVGGAYGQVLAFDALNGDKRWQVGMSSEVLSVQTGSGRVFVRTTDGRLTALDALNGERLWVLDHDLPVLSVRGMAPPLLLGNALVLGWESGTVEVVLQENGERVWESRIALPRGRTDVERMVDVQAGMLQDGSRIFAAATQAKVVALDVQTGSPWWQNDTSTWLDMALSGRRLFVVAEDDSIKALATDSGRALWVQDQLKYRRLSKPLAWDDQVLVADREGILHLLDAGDGALLARQEGAIEGMLVDGLEVASNRILLLDSSGSLSLWSSDATE